MTKRNCIIYLCRAAAADVNNLHRSLELLHANTKIESTTDIIIFHEEDFNPFIPALSSAYKLKFVEHAFKIPNYSQEILNKIPLYFPHPYSGIRGHSAEFSPGFDMGYRHMCRFFSGDIYSHPALKDYDYYIRLDSDSFILSPMKYDLFQWAADSNCYYGYISPAVQLDHPDVVKGLWEITKEWVDHYFEKSISEKFYCIQERKMYYTNFEIGKLSWFRESMYRKFWNYIDYTAGIYTSRWGDAPIRYIGVNLFMNTENIIPITGITYQHGAVYNV